MLQNFQAFIAAFPAFRNTVVGLLTSIVNYLMSTVGPALTALNAWKATTTQTLTELGTAVTLHSQKWLQFESWKATINGTVAQLQTTIANLSFDTFGNRSVTQWEQYIQSQIATESDLLKARLEMKGVMVVDIENYTQTDANGNLEPMDISGLVSTKIGELATGGDAGVLQIKVRGFRGAGTNVVLVLGETDVNGQKTDVEYPVTEGDEIYLPYNAAGAPKFDDIVFFDNATVDAINEVGASVSTIATALDDTRLLLTQTNTDLLALKTAFEAYVEGN